ncbi:tis1421-transposase a [Xanthomonas fragariae LMG 25863]|nr:tis1421-transposase a [Xanthomonas fragariae LMG 25863]
MTRRKEIPIALWKRIEPLIPQVKRSPKGGRPRISDQQALNGIVYVLRTGVPWEDLPMELVARRQGLRHRPLSRLPQAARHHCADRTQGDRAQRPVGPSSLGRRAHPCLVRRHGQTAHPL